MSMKILENLSDLLERTMMFTAARGSTGGKPQRLERAVTFKVDKPAPSSEATSVEQILTNRIWHWEYDHDHPNEIRNVQIVSRGMSKQPYSMSNTVFERVLFEDVEVVLEKDKKPIVLPIAKDYVLETYFLKEGRIAKGKDELWPLEANTDASILVALGYEVTPKGTVKPPPPKVVKDARTIEVSLGKANEAKQTKNTVRPPSPRYFIVCVSLTCCKERPDWEPGEVLGAARIYPHVMVMANHTVQEISAPVVLERPEMTIYTPMESDQPSETICGSVALDQTRTIEAPEPPEDSMMNNMIGAAYFTDTNEHHGPPRTVPVPMVQGMLPTLPPVPIVVPQKVGPPPLPLWNIFFDYYDLKPFTRYENRSPEQGDPKGLRAGECCFVDARKGERMTEPVVQRQQLTPITLSDRYGMDIFDKDEQNQWKDFFARNFYGEPERIKKVARQGEFDNVHLAPTMSTTFVLKEMKIEIGSLIRSLRKIFTLDDLKKKTPDDLKKTIDEAKKTIEISEEKKQIKDIVMAPFCVHDCLHMHVRWGTLGGDFGTNEIPASNRGFSGERPYQKVGACMVPENQSVFIKLLSAHAYRYRGVAHGPIKPNQMQVFFHHGASQSCDIWPGMSPKIWLAQSSIDWGLAEALDEPYTDGGMANAVGNWAVFYWRLRYGGWQMTNLFERDRNIVMERVRIRNLKKARCG